MKKIVITVCIVFCVSIALSACGDNYNEQNMANSVTESTQEGSSPPQNDVSMSVEETSNELIEEDASDSISDNDTNSKATDVQVPDGLSFTAMLNSYAVMEPNYVTALGLKDFSDYYLLIKNIYDSIGAVNIDIIYSNYEYYLYAGEYITNFIIPELYKNHNSTFDFSSHIDTILYQYPNGHPMKNPEYQEGKQICEQISDMLVNRFDVDELYPVVVVKNTGKDYYVALPYFIIEDLFEYHEFLEKQ